MATAACTANAVMASVSARVNGSPSSRSYRLSTPSTRPWAATGTLTWVVAVGSGPPLPAGLARTMARRVAATVPATPWPTGIRSAGSRWARPWVASRTRAVRSAVSSSRLPALARRAWTAASSTTASSLGRSWVEDRVSPRRFMERASSSRLERRGAQGGEVLAQLDPHALEGTGQPAHLPPERLTSLASTEPSRGAARQTTSPSSTIASRRESTPAVVGVAGMLTTSRARSRGSLVRSASRVLAASRCSSWLSIQMPAVTVPSRHRRDPGASTRGDAGRRCGAAASASWGPGVAGQQQGERRPPHPRQEPGGGVAGPTEHPAVGCGHGQQVVHPLGAQDRLHPGRVPGGHGLLGPLGPGGDRQHHDGDEEQRESGRSDTASPDEPVVCLFAVERSEAYRVRRSSPQSANYGCERPAPGS
jgi:hypothetical protein